MAAETLASDETKVITSIHRRSAYLVCCVVLALGACLWAVKSQKLGQAGAQAETHSYSSTPTLDGSRPFRGANTRPQSAWDCHFGRGRS